MKEGRYTTKFPYSFPSRTPYNSPVPGYALLSVSDKTGIEPFGRMLVGLGYKLLSTGGTQKALDAAKIPVTAVEELTKFPECFGGRVKTMHPLIMGGILFRRENADDVKEAKKLGIEPIDLVVVNLYPFADKPDSEMIDIGGPTLLRSAAKNHSNVTVVCDPKDYDRVIAELQRGDVSPRLRQDLAAKVFLHTAAYDAMITEWMSDGKNTGVMLGDGMNLRYGENPHQWGKYFEMYQPPSPSASEARRGGGVGGGGWKQLQGKELSYLNLLDADGAWIAACEFTDPTAVFVKHANPSGIASHAQIDEAFQRAYDADRLSAFGVVIALNRECTAAIAQKILDQKMFVELIIAPSFGKDVLEILKAKPNIRLLEMNSDVRSRHAVPQPPQYRSVLGGILVQNPDDRIITEKDLTIVTEKKPSADQIRDLLFAWKCVKHAKSNAIVFAKDLVTVGIGAGQTSRVDATWIAAKRSGLSARGAVMASDAFFPFPDSVEEAAKHGIVAIIQPGGSVKDAEVFAKANELGVAMVLTGVRAFRH
ncbi:bifunctional phosphoribosylaminoimidazolecarboxamide formyltransferase/IMP cyclohydrolase [Candidatus Peribacteria bacterium]|nr:bifunctional phosphoribosylaminoimidazolecarboxamide formyltransferase/IMP cyclohydrolase [Candidatus Peribacteria bacterium]